MSASQPSESHAIALLEEILVELEGAQVDAASIRRFFDVGEWLLAFEGVENAASAGSTPLALDPRITWLRDYFNDTPLTSWSSLHHRLESIVVENDEPFDRLTIQNARDFLRVAESRCPLPTGIAKGYWPTICVWWDGIEFEIGADKIEAYRFLDGKTLISEFMQRAGEPFREELVSCLPVASRLDT